MKIGFVLLIFYFSIPCWSQQTSANLNQVAVGQGISSPAITNTALFSKGFSKENPVAASYQNGYRGTLALDGANSTSFGLDMGVGDTTYGLTLGAYSNGCGDGQSGAECESFIRGNISAIWGDFGLGFGIQENLYTMGLLFNPNGLHRVGLVVEYEDPNGINNNRSALGVGYAFVMPQFTFSMDLSRRTLENNSLNDDAILFTPGIMVRVDIFSVSLNYDFYMSDTGDDFSDQVWVGVSARPFSDWEFTFYGEYIDRWTLMTTYFF